MNPAAFFIDGFNLYHSIDDNPAYHKYKWLNLSGLTLAYVRPDEEVISINYFTAYKFQNPEKYRRHNDLVRIYRDLGIYVILGAFRDKYRNCYYCGRQNKFAEEKRTDVNIAVTMLNLAYQGNYDVAYIISGDSDFIPAVKMIRDKFPRITIRLIIPIGRRAKELTSACHGRIKMKEFHLARNILPDPYVTKDDFKISRPSAWA